jgi:hypothetical protein
MNQLHLTRGTWVPDLIVLQSFSALALLAPLHSRCCLHTLAGSHTVLALLEHGHTAVLVDNLSNSFVRALDHVRRLAGHRAGGVKFVEVRRERREGRATPLATSAFH